jgi:hypothetical protein
LPVDHPYRVTTLRPTHPHRQIITAHHRGNRMKDRARDAQRRYSAKA